MDDGDWLVIGAAILLAMQKNVDWSAGSAPADWTWPVPDMFAAGHLTPAIISQEFRGAGAARPHYGVDLMYRNATPPPTFDAPVGTPIRAARSGTLWSIDHTARGWAIVLDHGKPWATFYQHIELPAADVLAGAQGRPMEPRRPGPAMRIAAGQALGTMGADPTDPARVRHLHFACWYQGVGDAASVDPSSVMARWRRTTWTR